MLIVDEIIDYLEYKDKVLFATFSVYYDRGAEVESLHQYINELRDSYVNECFDKYKEKLMDRAIKESVINVIKSKGADKNYSNKKTMNAFYNKLVTVNVLKK